MLEVKDLRVHFRSAPEGKDAVKGISFSVADRAIIGLVGESGSGKSVTAMSICGLLPEGKADCSGSILLDGLDLLNCTPEELRCRQGTDLAVVFQEPMTSLDPVMKIGPCLLYTSTQTAMRKLVPAPSRMREKMSRP